MQLQGDDLWIAVFLGFAVLLGIVAFLAFFLAIRADRRQQDQEDHTRSDK